MEHALFGTPVDRPTAEMPVIIPGPRISEVPARLQVAHPLAGRHALIVGINYAPEPTGIAPYTTGMAEHLAQHARTVNVLTGMPHYPNWTLDPAHRWVFRSSEAVPLGHGKGLSLKRARHYVPSRQSAITRAAYEVSFLMNASTTRLRNRPDLVIAVTPSLSGAVAGGLLARRHDAKLIVVVQDLMAKAAAQSGIRGGDYAARTTAAIERYALAQADRVAIVSDAFRHQLHEYGIRDEKIRLLPNWTHISPTQLSQSDCRRDLGWPVDPFTVVHTGNMGLKQDLGNMVAAARLYQQRDIHFVIVGDGSQRAEIEMQGAGVPNLTFVDPLDGDAYPKALAAADLLVVNERPGVGDMSLPSKLTSYLSTGRPILAAVAPNGATAQELQRTGGAALFVPPGNPMAFVEAVMTLRLNASRRSRMGSVGREYAESTLGEKAAAARLDDLIEECLKHAMTQRPTPTRPSVPMPVVSPPLTVEPALRVTQERSLRSFTGTGYDKGRSRAWQVLWFVVMNVAFMKWWMPMRYRPAILRAFGAQVGDRVRIRQNVRVQWPWKLAIGDDCWIGEGVWLLNLERITIEHDACLSQEAFLCTGSHLHRDPAFEFDNAPIHIGAGAWVAARATVLRGSHIRDGVLVGAGSVVRPAPGSRVTNH